MPSIAVVGGGFGGVGAVTMLARAGHHDVTVFERSERVGGVWTLAATWGQCPRAYLGLTVPGFPNMFLIYGPNTNGGTGSVIFTIEAGGQHVIAALDHLERRRTDHLEPAAYALT